MEKKISENIYSKSNYREEKRCDSRRWGKGGGGGDMKYLLKRLSSRQNFSCVFQVDDAMLMFDKTTNRHRGKCTASVPLSLHFFAQSF